MFNYLVEKHPEVDAESEDGMTSQNMAIQSRRKDIALALINMNSCYVSERDGRKLKLLYYAVAQNYTDVINAILEKNKSLEDKICIAAYLGNISVIELTQKGAKIKNVHTKTISY